MIQEHSIKRQELAIEGTKPIVNTDLQQVFERFLNEETAALLGFAQRLMGDTEEGRDLAQESLYRAYRSLGSFRQESSVKHWVWRILIHEGQKRQRHRRLVGQVQSWFKGQNFTGGAQGRSFGMQPAPNPEQLTGRKEQRARLGAALERLSVRQRTLVLLRYLEGLSVNEIAKLVGIGPGSVKTHLVRALRRLRECSEGTSAKVGP